MEIKINYEIADDIVVERLKEVYLFLEEDIKRLKNTERTDIQEADYNDWQYMQEGVLATLSYFMTALDLEDFLRGN